MCVSAGVTGTLLAVVGGVCQGKGGLLPIGKTWSGHLKRCLPIGKGLPCLQQYQSDVSIAVQGHLDQGQRGSAAYWQDLEWAPEVLSARWKGAALPTKVPINFQVTNAAASSQGRRRLLSRMLNSALTAALGVVKARLEAVGSQSLVAKHLGSTAQHCDSTDKPAWQPAA